MHPATPRHRISGILLGCLLLCAASCVSARQGTVLAATPDPETAIRALVQTEQTSWNAADSATYASVYTEDADFINIRGQIFSGKTAIDQRHAAIFAGPFKGSTIAITVRRFRLLSPGLALVDTDQKVTSFAFLAPGIVPTTPGTLLTHFKYIAAAQGDGTWKFISGQNTAVLPSPPAS